MRYNQSSEYVEIGRRKARKITVHERMDGYALLGACAKAKPFIPATYHGRGQPITNRQTPTHPGLPARCGALIEKANSFQSGRDQYSVALSSLSSQPASPALSLYCNWRVLPVGLALESPAL